jgi:hypothetical protein
MKKPLFFLFALLLVSISSAQDAPKTMIKVEVRLQSPDAPPGSFLSLPKVMYRAGTRYCRIEEAEDTRNGIHAVAIVSEPDFWMVNLVTKTARHAVDPGPSFECHLPIFANADPSVAKDEMSGLEFGRELAFFKSKGVQPHPGPVLQNQQTTAYALKVGTISYMLFTYGPSEHPLGLARQEGEKNEIFWYSGYGEIPFDPKLFAKPEGIKIENQTP